METHIQDLLARHDTDALIEMMTGSDDEVVQVDAAEALIKLGDRRGLKFLLLAETSGDKHLREFAEELLDSEGMKGMRAAMEAEEEREHEARVGEAKKRLQKGRKVFRYKVVFIPAEDLLQEDLLEEGIDLFDLSEAGLAGWEVVNLIPRRQLILDINDRSTGAYALLKKEVAPEEGAELDET